MTSTDEDDIFDAADQLADSGLYGSNQRYYQMLLENNYVSDLSKVIFKDNITSMYYVGWAFEWFGRYKWIVRHSDV